MLLLTIFQPKKLNYVVLFLALTFLEIVKAETKETSKLEGDNKTPAGVLMEQKSVKKELKVNKSDEAIVEITPRNEKDDRHTEKLVIIGEKTVSESSGKGLIQAIVQKTTEMTSIVETVTILSSSQLQHGEHHFNEEFILNDEDDISESLKTGFYFFLILSSGAIVFIIFKIYRLRLSRAERKYGVQGDRSTQELTPLPISIEDGHSDDEDQTLFDIQRQNVRIL